MQKLIINPELQALIPPLTAEEYQQLTDNILAEGIREAILTWNGTIVDGHNRYAIAQEFGIPFTTKATEFSNLNECKEWMIRNQFGRRNLQAFQRSVLALELEQVFRDKAKANQAIQYKGSSLSQKSDEVKPIKTGKELAKIANVSHDTIAKVKVLQAKASDEVKEQLRTGEVSINQAYKDIKKEEKVQQRLQQIEEKAEIGKNKSIDVDFRLGDFEEVFANIPNGSVDCIITDPPYPREFIECWTKLARFAKRVLKPNGFCIAYSGQMNLPEVISRMSQYLDYYWTFAVYHEGQTQIVNGVNIICRWKPILIFQNGRKQLPYVIQDYFISEKREKDGHEWQQSVSGVSYLIQKFTEENDLICEPFAGSGTTIIAAKQLNRQIIAAEINEQSYNVAKERI